MICLLGVCISSVSAQKCFENLGDVKKLAGGMTFTEGPIADAKGDVYFSDIPPNKIMKWSEEEGLSVFKSDIPGCNGLYFDMDSNMIVAGNNNSQSVWKLNMKTDEISILADQRNGVKYNGPNDLWINKNGGIYFTDPLYGKRDPHVPKLDSESVYYISPDGKKVIEVINDFVRPNGIIATPDEKVLYAADINDGKIYTYKMKSNGTLKDKALFVSEPCDGMTLDVEGNLYITNSNVKIFNANGEKLTEIDIPERPTNVCFGGKDRKTLYITARTGFYSINLNIAGAY